MEVVFMGVLLACALVALAVALMRRRTAAAAHQQARSELNALQKRLADLQAENEALARYRSIPDAEKRAANILADAERNAAGLLEQARTEQERIRASALEERTQVAREVQERKERAASEANRLVEAASKRAQEERDRAALDLQESKKRADRLISEAAAEATRTIEAAHRRALEIAGEAQDAMRNVEQLKQTTEALKNVIKGYGDEYVVPTYSLLDELADEFGHAEAGQKLKAAREHMRQLIKQRTAAACDYVEDNRKTTAIDFVLDAFNGKVDTVLSSVKHDNHGTLAQKIRDAFNIVNHNGKAFRNARITPEYLQARLDELHWAAVAQELKLAEREEQRLIKEKIREEEKAQREYERAMKEAQKEEDVLRKAMEKAQREIEKASDEQKARYEEQLRELNEKLKAAEEKNQRALSMAQQTRSGHVYVISNIGSFGEHVYKIGLTRRLEPLERIKELGDASVPFEFDVHALIQSDDAPALERELHKRFVRMQVNKVNPRKEFFRLTLPDIRQELERLGHQARWTMTAECREYKETLAIERAMQDKTFQEGKWLEKQLQEQETELEQLAG